MNPAVESCGLVDDVLLSLQIPRTRSGPSDPGHCQNQHARKHPSSPRQHSIMNSCLSFPPRLLGLFRLLFLCVLLHSCKGHYNLISSRQPIVARVGDDVMLPCHLEPVMDVAGKKLEWTRPDLNYIYVLVWRSGQELMKMKHPSYTGRSSLFTDGLKHGNISLKLSKVTLSDKGTYKCLIPDLRSESVVQLVVASDAAAPLFITLSGTDRDSGELVLQCESKGWYPEPEVLWLDGEGHILSAGPTETVRGPNDLYTVSSRVTVDKRHRNRFTCRVQQTNINQTRETHLHVSDDLFKVPSSFSATTVGLIVGLALCVMLILLLVFFLWRKKKTSKRNKQDSTKGNVEMETNDTDGNLITTNNQLQEEKKKRQKTEEEVTTLKNQLQDEIQRRKETEEQLNVRLKEKTKEVQTLSTENNRLEDKVKKLEKDVETKLTELKQLSDDKKGA